MRTFAAFFFIVLAPAPAGAAEYASLPKGQGSEVMVRVCSQCHSPELTATKNMDQAGWKALVDQMANNGAQASDAEFDTITKYLAASFPANRTAEPVQQTRTNSGAAIQPRPANLSNQQRQLRKANPKVKRSRHA